MLRLVHCKLRMFSLFLCMLPVFCWLPFLPPDWLPSGLWESKHWGGYSYYMLSSKEWSHLNPQRASVTLQDTSLLLPRFGCCVWTPLLRKRSFPHPLLLFNSTDEWPLARHPRTRRSSVNIHTHLTPPTSGMIPSTCKKENCLPRGVRSFLQAI